MKEGEFRVYPWRWYVLGVVMLLNGSNAMSWIGYAPVANFVDEFYAWPVLFSLCSPSWGQR